MQYPAMSKKTQLNKQKDCMLEPFHYTTSKECVLIYAIKWRKN